ncbi:TlpA family protein disulfide reductase [Sphingobacterium detergens]|uniref:Thiol-disulfide isomerase/thioredoxin n=1 Tax=Sphingobacterium detergens TaxID=1145106 RepID=A0A420AQM3_SPHD1|nr:TlpA disulfide reductase family protein [Sphingobacterium detergens]RKE46740.1 thiol-disulfide isomerase/thioredoxin [Sphingobacterium detergens]
MKQKISYLILLICGFLFSRNNYAQRGFTTLSGTFDQKKNYEITIIGKEADRSFRLAKAVVDTSTNKFMLPVPVRNGIHYSMRIDRMKEGHRRLELDQSINFPIQFNGQQNLELNITANLFGQGKNAASPKMTTANRLPHSAFVSGVIDHATVGAELSLEKVVNGQTQIVQTNFVARGDSVFNFAIPMEKDGFYYISTIRTKKAIYLHPGDDIDIRLDIATGTEVGATKTTSENKQIAQWEKVKLPLLKILMQQKPDREAFTQAYKPVQSSLGAFIAQIKTNNSRFNELFKTTVQLDNDLLALQMLLKSSTEKRGVYWMPSKEFVDVPDYYKGLLIGHMLNSADLLTLGDGYSYLNLSARFSLLQVDEAKRKQLTDAEKVGLYMAAVENETLKPLILKSQLEDLEFNISNYSEFREIFLPFKRYAQVGNIQKKYNGLLNMFVADTAYIGKSSYNFTLPDMEGKTVSMKDFKGKVILIDVWATWCGPCKAQIPFFKEIEEEYKGNDNIVFVGISLDSEKDKAKWLSAIKEKELGGIQLLDDRGKFFGKQYGITAIPRFCLIDKEGNWSEIRCPLPEQKEKLKKYINQLL